MGSYIYVYTYRIIVSVNLTIVYPPEIFVMIFYIVQYSELTKCWWIVDWLEWIVSSVADPVPYFGSGSANPILKSLNKDPNFDTDLQH